MKEYSQMLDSIDKAILNELQLNSRISNVDLAQRVNLSPPAVHTRIKRLENLGYVAQYTAILDREKVGYEMICFINVTLALHQSQQIDAFREAIQAMPEVLECHFLTGEYDYLLKVAIRSRQELEIFLMQRLTPIPGIARINTSVVLGEIKNTTMLALD